MYPGTCLCVAGQVLAVPHALAVALAVSAFWVHIGRVVCLAGLACAGHAWHGGLVSERAALQFQGSPCI